MAAYIVGDIEITDPAGYEEYRRNVGATSTRYGGKTIVARGKFEVLEGDWRPQGLVVLEFESAARAREWYDSDEYRPLKRLRARCTNSNLILIEGL